MSISSRRDTNFDEKNVNLSRDFRSQLNLDDARNEVAPGDEAANTCLPCLPSTGIRTFSPGQTSSKRKTLSKISFKWKEGHADITIGQCFQICYVIKYLVFIIVCWIEKLSEKTRERKLKINWIQPDIYVHNRKPLRNYIMKLLS